MTEVKKEEVKVEVKKEEVKPVNAPIKANVVENVAIASKEGIKETKDCVIFLAKLGASIAQCSINDKFQITAFLDDIKAVPAALSGINNVAKEIKDLDADEIKELLNVVVEELKPLGISNLDVAEKFVDAGIKFFEGTMIIVNYFKETKAK